jgi:hypothetical protein
MADKVKTDFPAMGDSGIPNEIVNMSGNRSPYTMAGGPRGGPGKSDAPDSSDGIRKSVTINEAHGPRLAPITRIYEGNAAEAGLSGRNLRLMKPTEGNFWEKRVNGPVIGKPTR